MGDDEGGTVFFVAGTQEGKGHALGAVLIEGGGGLVEQEEGLREGEGSGDEEALALATGELRGALLQEGGIQGEGGEEGGEGCPLQGAVALQVEGEAEEVAAGVGDGLELLRHVGCALADEVDVGGVEGHPEKKSSFGFQGHEAQESTKERCLTTTAFARDANEPPGVNREVETGEQRPIPEGDGSVNKREKDSPPALPIREGAVCVAIGVLSHYLIHL